MRKSNYFTNPEWDFSVDFDNMAMRQGIYSITRGFNIQDTMNKFLPED